MSECVRCEIDAGLIARLILDDPASRANTLHRAMWEQLGVAIAGVAGRRELHGLVIQSTKPGIFVAGADLREIADLPLDDPAPTRTLVRRGRDVLTALEALPFPTMAVIDGAALGGGFELALACDFRVAGMNPKLKIGLPEVKLGLIPGWGGTQRPARIAGALAGAKLVCSGEPLNGAAAKETGLVDGIADTEQLDDLAVGMLVAQQRKPIWQKRRAQKRSAIANLPDLSPIHAWMEGSPADQRVAAGEALRVLVEGARVSLADALDIEEAAFVPLVASETARRLVNSFLKRT